MANETRVFKMPQGMSVETVAQAVESYLRSSQNLQVQGAQTGDGYVLQCRQEKDGWKTVTGMRLATTVQMTLSGDTLNVTIGAGEWSDKIGAGVAGLVLFWPLAVTAGIGAYKQKKLPDEIFRVIENCLMSGGAQPFAAAPVATAPAAKTICPACGAELAAGSRFCNLCGAKLEEKPVCKGCGAPLSPGSRFCPQCGKAVE